MWLSDGVTLVCLCVCRHTGKCLNQSSVTRSLRMCVYVHACVCHQRKQQQEAGASIRRRQSGEGDAGGRHPPSRARAHTPHSHTHKA